MSSGRGQDEREVPGDGGWIFGGPNVPRRGLDGQHPIFRAFCNIVRKIWKLQNNSPALG